MSYDSVDTVSRFADLQGITFPLLADEWGPAIKDLGLTDPDMRKHHARYATRPLSYYRGVALPGVFVLDGDGVITDKRFHETRMERGRSGHSARGGLEHRGTASGRPTGSNLRCGLGQSLLRLAFISALAAPPTHRRTGHRRRLAHICRRDRASLSRPAPRHRRSGRRQRRAADMARCATAFT